MGNIQTRSIGRDRIDAYAAAGKELGLWPRAGSLLYYLNRQLFKGTEFAGKTVLDVGCSNGRFSAWAALNGAGRVVGLEPMGAGSGSSHNAHYYFNEFARRLDLPCMEIHDATFQDYECPDNTFDVVLMHAVVNHLDEDACIILGESEDARRKYREIFRRLHSMMKTDARLIIVDAARNYLFSALGMGRNPLDRKIDFKKHQDPEYWAAMLSDAGFETRRISWISKNRYRQLGAPFRSKPVAYLLALAFRLEMICRK
jgi:SAM-dependent methyltransferase